jgi:hypothetical protein
MTGIIAVFSSFTLYVLVHWLVCRTLNLRPHSRVLNVIWICFLPVYTTIFWALSMKYAALAVDLKGINGIANFLNGLLIDGLLLIGYTGFFFLVERGLSMRLMIEISRASERKMTTDDIKQVYTYDYILEKRLGQMFKMGCAVKQGGFICNTKKGSRVAASNKRIRQILRMEQVMP